MLFLHKQLKHTISDIFFLILFAFKLRRLQAKLTFPPCFQTWKKYVFLRYLLNYAYDFIQIKPIDIKRCNHSKVEIKSGGHRIALEDLEKTRSFSF